MLLLFYVGEFVMLSRSKDKIDELYASILEYFKIEDDEELNKYLGIDMYYRPDGSIHLRQPYQTQIILNIISVVDKSSANPTPLVKTPLAKNEGTQERKNILIIDQ